MHIIMRFNMANEDDVVEHRLMMRAKDMWMAMWEFYNDSLRTRLKYADLPEDVENEVHRIAEEFFDALDRFEINLDTLP